MKLINMTYFSKTVSERLQKHSKKTMNVATTIITASRVDLFWKQMMRIITHKMEKKEDVFSDLYFKNSIGIWHDDRILLVILFIIRCIFLGWNCPCFKIKRVWIMRHIRLLFIIKLVTVRIWIFKKLIIFYTWHIFYTVLFCKKNRNLKKDISPIKNLWPFCYNMH